MKNNSCDQLVFRFDAEIPPTLALEFYYNPSASLSSFSHYVNFPPPHPSLTHHIFLYSLPEMDYVVGNTGRFHCIRGRRLV